MSQERTEEKRLMKTFEDCIEKGNCIEIKAILENVSHSEEEELRRYGYSMNDRLLTSYFREVDQSLKRGSCDMKEVVLLCAEIR